MIRLLGGSEYPWFADLDWYTTPDGIISETHLGPVGDVVYTFRPSWSTSPDAPMETVAFGGMVLLSQARQLESLVSNPDAWTTIAGVSGVLEYVWMGAAAISPFTGWYLLTNASYEPQKPGDFIPHTELSLDGMFLGERDPVLLRYSRTLDNDWDIPGVAVVSTPFHDETGDGFLVPPGGTKLIREYDPTSPVNADPVPGAEMVLYQAAIVTDDPLNPIAEPVVSRTSSGIPPFVTHRGGDVRAYDRRLEEEVYGPLHTFLHETDLSVTNGILRFTVGPRLLQAYLDVEVFRDGAWQPVGCLYLADGELLSCKVLGRTRNRAEIVLVCRGVGAVTVILCRHERMIRVQGKDSVSWRPGPPAHLLNASLTMVHGPVHRHGLTLGAGGFAALDWPTDVHETSHAAWICWLPETSSTTIATSGIGAFMRNYVEIGTLIFDTADNTFVWTAGGQALRSPPVTFTANEPVVILARQGLTSRTLSIQADGVVSHVSDSYVPDAPYDMLSVGKTGGTVQTSGFGQFGFGQGGFGGLVSSGGTLANGPIDCVRIFESPLTDRDAENMLLAYDIREEIGHPEGRMVLQWAFDWTMTTGGSEVSQGMTTETLADNGPSRYTDMRGMTRGLASRHAVTKGAGLRLEADELEVGAFVATTVDGDNVNDQRAQYMTANFQELTVR